MKILRISKCGECPYCAMDINATRRECSAKYHKFICWDMLEDDYILKSIPEWCPLEDTDG